MEMLLSAIMCNSIYNKAPLSFNRSKRIRSLYLGSMYLNISLLWQPSLLLVALHNKVSLFSHGSLGIGLL